MDIMDQEYRDCVVAWFNQHKFCECSFKDANHWYEVLDPRWNWDKFDYRIPCYDQSKSVDDAMHTGTDNAINDINNFVAHKA